MAELTLIEHMNVSKADIVDLGVQKVRVRKLRLKRAVGRDLHFTVTSCYVRRQHGYSNETY